MRSAKVLLALAAACAAVVAQTPAKQQPPKVKTEAKQQAQTPPPAEKQEPEAQPQPDATAPTASPVAASTATDPRVSQILVKESPDNYTVKRDYVLGPNDTLELRVFDEPQLNGDFDVDADGKVLFPFVDEPLVAQCRTVNDLRKDLTAALAKFLKNPRVFLRVKEQRSHNPALVFGAVLVHQRYEMRRPARLLELIADSGGVTEQHSGTIQITHTEPPQCGEPGAAQSHAGTDELGQPYDIYNVADLRSGKSEANPYIRNGDIIYVAEASPIYIVGNVGQPTSLYLKDGMQLSRVLAMVGGIKNGNEEKITIRRIKPGTSDAEILTVNYKAIKQGKAKDFDLKPYDIIVVPGEGFTLSAALKTAAGMARNAGTSIAMNAPLRIIY